MTEAKRFEMPLVVCKAGSGLAALTTLGVAAGVVVGGGSYLIQRDKLRSEIRMQELRREYARTGRFPDSPEPPAWLTAVPWMILAGLLLAILWALRQGFYAHCLRYWHPEIAPPRKVRCPECSGCELCDGTRQVDEGATLPEEPDDLWVDADGALWHGPLDRPGTNHRYAKLIPERMRLDGAPGYAWQLLRREPDPAWRAFEYPEAP